MKEVVLSGKKLNGKIIKETEKEIHVKLDAPWGTKVVITQKNT